jgi:hypothetical protein
MIRYSGSSSALCSNEAMLIREASVSNPDSKRAAVVGVSLRRALTAIRFSVHTDTTIRESDSP